MFPLYEGFYRDVISLDSCIKPQKAKKVAIKYNSYRVIYLFKDVPVGPPLVMGKPFSGISAYLDNCRRKRNVSEYDAVGTISEKEAADLLLAVQELNLEVLKWFQQDYPELCGHRG